MNTLADDVLPSGAGNGLCVLMPTVTVEWLGDFQNRFPHGRAQGEFIVLAQLETWIERTDFLEQVTTDRLQMTGQHSDVEQPINGVFVPSKTQHVVQIINVGH